MGDTTEQMEVLKKKAVEKATSFQHELGPFKEFAGGSVSVALCKKCTRFAVAEVYPSDNVRGTAVTLECGGRKVENSI